jgi:RNA polymerase sigma factor (sigma-70 family)
MRVLDRRIAEDLYRSLQRFAGAVAPREVDPDDLVQEALYRTLCRFHLAELDNPGAYLRRTIVNLAANERRALGRTRRRLQAGVEEPAALATYPSDVSDLLRLPPDARAVLWMAEVEGAPYAEIAAVLGCTEEAARTKGARARRRLRIEITRDIAQDMT